MLALADFEFNIMPHFDLPDHQIENDKNYYFFMKNISVSEFADTIITNKFSNNNILQIIY